MRSKSYLAAIIAMLFLAAAFCIHSCTSGNGGNDGGTGKDAASDGGGTGDGAVDLDGGGDNKIIVQDTCLSGKDQECPPDKICNIETAKCVDGKKCNGGNLWECAAQTDPDNPDYCGNDSIYCYCDQEGKTCKRRLLICETCNLDKECGENYQEGGEEDRCIDYPDGVKRCGKACGTKACPAGFYCDTKVTPLDGGTGPNQGQCRPSKINTLDPDSCEGVNVCKTVDDCRDPNRPRCQFYMTGSSIGVCSSYCTTDNDCRADPDTGEIRVCNIMTKSCVAGCVDNAGVPNDKKCSTSYVCHSNGKCGSQCDPTKNGSDCESWFGTATSWTCELDDTIYRCQFCLEKNPDGKTCKVTGCMNDGQCSVPGYCDRLTRKCMDGKCRDIRDCTSGFKCDKGDCVKMDCIENGGQINCGLYEFCCGEKSDVKCKDPTGTNVDAGVCYEATTPPWCTKCESNDDCTTDAGFDGYCFEFQDQDGGTKGKFCGVPCQIVDNKPIKGQCPRGHQCTQVKDDQGAIVTTTCLWARCVDWNSPKDAGTSGGDN